MNGPLAKFGNRQIAIRVREGLRNQAVASTLMAKKARAGRNTTENRERRRVADRQGNDITMKAALADELPKIAMASK